MTVEVKVPRLAESVSDAVLVEWLKDDGTAVKTDEPIVTLETDKAAVEIPATENGVLHHARQAGDRVQVGDVLASIDTDAAPPVKGAPPLGPDQKGNALPAAGAPEVALSPAVRRLIEEHGLKPQDIESSGRGGRLLKEDVLKHLERAQGAGGPPDPGTKEPVASPAPSPPLQVPLPRATRVEAPAARAGPEVPPGPAPPKAEPAPREPAPAVAAPAAQAPDEQVVPMTRIRQRIAERLVRAQHTAAILTTFNEIDMTEVLALRTRYREDFERRHGVRLGFMSFFSRACILALAEIPELNAEIRDGNIVYHRRVHLGIAVQTERGLVVPVVRNADGLGFADLEREIARLAERGRDGVLALHELSGGTFTISNGGVYGSLLSTPILNPPQSGILGMHKIERRPIAVDDQVVVRSMMYVALSYDHRIVDGQQAVTFLVRVKACLEDPGRMLLDV